MITIVDYGMGNLRSVQKAFEKIGAEALVTSDPKEVEAAERLVLPGVGAMCDAVSQLEKGNLIPAIKNHIARDKPFLGICLGLQMLFTRSYENGIHAGLDIFPGEVQRFELPRPLKIPHMGWNQLRLSRANPLFVGLPTAPSVYFVHSYYAIPSQREIIAAEADYGGYFTAMVWQRNLFATQFHPEKSQKVGLGMLKNFATYTPAA